MKMHLIEMAASALFSSNPMFLFRKFCRQLSVGGYSGCGCANFRIIESTMPYYAVARGRAPGVFNTWNECEDQVKGFSGARYKKFNTESEARSFVTENSNGGGSYAGSSGGYRSNVSSYSTTGSSAPVRTYSTSSAAVEKRKPAATYLRQRQEVRALGSGNSSFNLEGIDDPGQINEAFSKHLDLIESRLECVKNNVDKIYGGSTGVCGKRTLPTEPHDESKRRRNNQYDTDERGYTQVFTDGACPSNGQRGARAGYGVWWGDDHPLNECGPVDRPTNNSGEIQAAVRACQQAKESGQTKLCINTDSKFLIDSATKWMPGWKENNWQLKSGGPVKNKRDFLELDRSAQGLDVKWRYVEAHRGVYGNEKADELARRGAAGYTH